MRNPIDEQRSFREAEGEKERALDLNEGHRQTLNTKDFRIALLLAMRTSKERNLHERRLRHRWVTFHLTSSARDIFC